MLSEIEKKGCLDILRRLSRTDVYSLVDTITKKAIRPSNSEEAIEAILNYSENPTELLQRRKVKRDLLLQYVNDKKMKVAITADKKTLIISILTQWGSLVDYDLLDAVDSSSSSSLLSKSTGPRQPSASPSGQNPTPWATAGATAGASNTSPQQVNIQVHNHFNSPGVNAQTNFNFMSPSNSSSPPTEGSRVQASGGQQKNETLVLGTKFVEWFYDNLNSHNPVIGSAKDFGAQHFWDDVALTVFTPNKTEEHFEGPIAVADCFLNYTKNEQLLFSANMSSEGLVVKMNPHGLVAIMVCGTVHRANECLGVFQQAFGIIKDPRFNDNWKIKMSKLQVSSQPSSSVPKLPSSAESDLLAIM